MFSHPTPTQSLRRQTESRAGVCDTIFLGVRGHGAGIVPAAVRFLRLRLQLRVGPDSHPSADPAVALCARTEVCAERTRVSRRSRAADGTRVGEPD